MAPSLGGKIASMKKEVRRGKAEEKRLAKELRNAEKRRKRLRARCKELPAEDLLQALAMCQVRDAEVAAAESQE